MDFENKVRSFKEMWIIRHSNRNMEKWMAAPKSKSESESEINLFDHVTILIHDYHASIYSFSHPLDVIVSTT